MQSIKKIEIGMRVLTPVIFSHSGGGETKATLAS